MGWRFRRTIRILPGVRLNLSKSGISTSLGGPGATLNFGKRGARATVGLPGTGISYSTRLGAGVAETGSDPGGAAPGRRWGCIIVAALALAGGIALFRAPHTPTRPTAAAADIVAAPDAQPGTASRFVVPRLLNCRAAPSPTAPVVRHFGAGDRVVVAAEETAGWARVIGEPSCWVARRFLSDTQRAAEAASEAAAGASAAPVAAAAPACPCSGPQLCTGPRGGRYCLTATGRKRYRH